MKRGFLMGLLVGVLCIAGTASAQEGYGRGQGWSVLSGQTVGSGGNVLTGEVGWPGLSLGLLHGATSRVDIGGKFSFNYGREGIVTSVVPGVKLQAMLRVMLLETSRVNLGLTFAPGPLFYFYDYGTDVGLALPVSVNVGIPVGSAVMFNAGLDIPFYVIFGSGGGPVFPLLVGGGVEYFIDRNLALTFNVRMGPSVFPYDDFHYRGRSRFTLNAMFGLAFHL